MEKITYKSIGVIHTPHKEPSGIPIQAKAAETIEGTVEVFAEYAEGLKDLSGFSHIVLIYHFHRSRKAALHQKPFLDDEERGVFAIRSPSRPNPVGLSVVRLVGVENNILTVKGLDILDGTPLIDIKPYVPEFDVFEVDRIGWLERHIEKLREMRDDGRFAVDDK